jgi:poly(3-hydroxybutyrate) depolymerase
MSYSDTPCWCGSRLARLKIGHYSGTSPKPKLHETAVTMKSSGLVSALLSLLLPHQTIGQLSPEKIKGVNTFCDVSPDALTKSLSGKTEGQPVPQYCIKNPVSGGKQRCYYLLVPKCANGRVPLVMNMHGGASCPVWSSGFDGWVEKSVLRCFALAYPIAVTDADVADEPCFSVPGGRNVNSMFTTNECCCSKDGRTLRSIETQDMVVIHNMVQDIVFEKRVELLSNHSVQVDKTRIYMAGHSNGCVAALGMGAMFSNLVAAVCCHAAGSFVDVPPTYDPVPTWLAQGVKDDRIWYQFARDTTLTLGWVHQCSEESTFVLQNGSAVRHTQYNCTNNASVTLLLLKESGHIPFLNAFEISEGASHTTVDTTDMAWRFCSSFSKDEIPLSLRSPTSAGTRAIELNLEAIVVTTLLFVLALYN